MLFRPFVIGATLAASCINVDAKKNDALVSDGHVYFQGRKDDGITNIPDYFWSNADSKDSFITRDGEFNVISDVVMVKILGKKTFDEISSEIFKDYFDNFKSDDHDQQRTFILHAELAGKNTIVSLSKVKEDMTKDFENLIASQDGDSIFTERFKLLLAPKNLALPLPTKGPSSADYMGDFFGKNNCFVKTEVLGENENIRVVIIGVDLYSVWIIRQTLPLLAFKSGRISDFFVVDYPSRNIVVNFRLKT
jgi:hypothetical protein